MNLKRWITRNSGSKLDAAALTLTLRARGVEAPLLRYTRDDVDMTRPDELSREIEERANEHAEEQRCAVSFRLTWERADESAVVGQPFTCGEGAQQLDGSTESQLAQGQRERAELHRFASEAMKLAIAELRHIVDVQNEQLEKLRNENEALRAERIDEIANEQSTGKRVAQESMTEKIVGRLMDSHGEKVVEALKQLVTGEDTKLTTEPTP